MPTTTETAVESVTQGDGGHAYTMTTIVHRFEAAYLNYTRLSQTLTEKGAKIKNRVLSARALECATFLTEYYRRTGNMDVAQEWESRRRLAEAKAYNHRKSIVVNIGAGPDDA